MITPPGDCSVGVTSIIDILTWAGAFIANIIHSAISVACKTVNPVVIFFLSSRLSIATLKNSVATLPGFISVHLTPVPDYSILRFWLIKCTAPLEPPYTELDKG